MYNTVVLLSVLQWICNFIIRCTCLRALILMTLVCITRKYFVMVMVQYLAKMVVWNSYWACLCNSMEHLSRNSSFVLFQVLRGFIMSWIDKFYTGCQPTATLLFYPGVGPAMGANPLEEFVCYSRYERKFIIQ